MTRDRRSSQVEVRNPVLALPAARHLAALPPDARAVLAAVLDDIRQDAANRAETCWRRHKAPMAAYWKAVAVYARHIRRAIPPARSAPSACPILPVLRPGAAGVHAWEHLLMAICPNEHFHFLLHALRDRDREYVLVLLSELLTWLVVPCNPLPQPSTSSVHDEGLDLAEPLLREAAARKRALAVDVPSIAETSSRQARALEQVADALAGVRQLTAIVLVE